jgi:DNA-directed RNA polymerase specialized sigma24 family protein
MTTFSMVPEPVALGGAWSPAARNVLEGATLHRELCSMVRRRVPRSEVEDVVQGVLCDALAASNVPESPADVPRWVMGIARHKVADFHRRARREQLSDAADAEPLSDPIEDRFLLHAVLADGDQAATRETLRWVVREFAGEQLNDIAREAALPATVVRQRVSRFRRRMRARWLYAAAAALGLLGFLAQRSAETGLQPGLELASSAPIELDATTLAPRTLPAVATARPLAAHYRVVDVSLPLLLDELTGSWAGEEAHGARIDWNADVVTIDTPTRHIEGRVALRAMADGSERGTITLADGRSLPIVVRTEGMRTRVELVGVGDAEGNIFGGGSVVIER